MAVWWRSARKSSSWVGVMSADGAEPVVNDLGLVIAKGVGGEFAFGDDADVDCDVAQAGLAHE